MKSSPALADRRHDTVFCLLHMDCTIKSSLALADRHDATRSDLLCLGGWGEVEWSGVVWGGVGCGGCDIVLSLLHVDRMRRHEIFSCTCFMGEVAVTACRWEGFMMHLVSYATMLCLNKIKLASSEPPYTFQWRRPSLLHQT